MCHVCVNAESGCAGVHTVCMCAQDYAGWTGGLPDLILWRPQVVDQLCVQSLQSSSSLCITVQPSITSTNSSIPAHAVDAVEQSIGSSSSLATATNSMKADDDDDDDSDICIIESKSTVVSPPYPLPSSTRHTPTSDKKRKLHPRKQMTKRTVPSPAQQLYTSLSMDDDDDEEVTCTGYKLLNDSTDSCSPQHRQQRASTPSIGAAQPTSPFCGGWPACKFVEVKGPRDKLSHQQISWLNLLSSCCAVEVCYVNEPNMRAKQNEKHAGDLTDEEEM